MSSESSQLQPLTPIASPFGVLATDAQAMSESEVAMQIDALLQPQVKAQTTQDALAQLQAQVSAHPKSIEQPWVALSDLGFTGNAAAYSASNNSSLRWVLEHRSGIPISLAIVLITVARGLGCQAQGLNHPGHFLVRINAALVDPFRMCLVPPEAEVFQSAQAAPVASPADIGLRMLNNLKYVSLQEQRWVDGLNWLDHQLAMRPLAWDLWFERASLWQQLGSYSSAELICRALVAESLPPQLAADVEARLKQLEERPPQTLH